MLHTDVYKEKQVSIDGSINGFGHPENSERLREIQEQARWEREG